MKQECRNDFANHVATLTNYGDDLSILIWAKPGTNNYYVRYIFDKCLLYITGDLGDAVVRLTESANLKNLSHYIRSISYFIEKIQCSTDKYDFDEDTAIEKLNEERECYLEYAEGDDRISNINEIFDDLISAARDSEWEHVLHNEDIYDRISDIDPDAFEWMHTVGRVYDRRVILWLVGLQMAWEQICG